MITLIQLNKEIAELKATKWYDLKPGQRKRKKAHLDFLELVRHYLETAPSEEFVEREKSKIDKWLSTIKDRFGAWSFANKQEGKTLKEQQKAFEKEYDVKKLRAQQRALSFILNKKYTNENVES